MTTESLFDSIDHDHIFQYDPTFERFELPRNNDILKHKTPMWSDGTELMDYDYSTKIATVAITGKHVLKTEEITYLDKPHPAINSKHCIIHSKSATYSGSHNESDIHYPNRYTPLIIMLVKLTEPQAEEIEKILSTKRSGFRRIKTSLTQIK